MGKAVNMAFERGVLTIDNCTPEDYESIWRPYLDMDRDYGAIKAELSEADPTIKGACDYGYGIRILRQDFWESVVSFIIHRITTYRGSKAVSRLSALLLERG